MERPLKNLNSQGRILQRDEMEVCQTLSGAKKTRFLNSKINRRVEISGLEGQREEMPHNPEQ